jgi:hypothetical protein
VCKKASSLLSSGGSCEVLEIGKVRPLVTFLLFLLSALPVTAAESKTPQLQHPNRASHQLSNADLTHGENQVKKLLVDRPELTLRISKGDSAYQWLLRNFAGEHTGYMIYWESSNPSNGADGENRFDDYSNRGAIRAKKMSESNALVAAETQATIVVFELINNRNTPRFKALWKNALNGKISKKDWIRGATQLEFEAIQKTENFYLRNWLPLMKSKYLATDAHLWRIDTPSHYDFWIKTKDAEKFIQYWGSCYPETTDMPHPLDRKTFHLPSN